MPGNSPDGSPVSDREDNPYTMCVAVCTDCGYRANDLEFEEEGGCPRCICRVEEKLPDLVHYLQLGGRL